MAVNANFNFYLSYGASEHDLQGFGKSAETAHERLVSKLVQDAQVKYARFFCPATLFALGLLSRIDRSALGPPDDLGVITTAGPYHLRNAWQSTERVNKKGCRFVTPAEFPHTIISSVPTAIASVLNARAFAFATGDTELAFFQNIFRALSMLEQGYARTVLVCTAYIVDSVVADRLTAMGRTPSPEPFTASMLISNRNPPEAEYSIESLHRDGREILNDALAPELQTGEAVTRMTAIVGGDGDLKVAGGPNQTIQGHLSASGALFLHEAMSHIASSGLDKLFAGMESECGDSIGIVIGRKR